MEAMGYKGPKASRTLTLAGAHRVKGEANMVKVLVVAALLLVIGTVTGSATTVTQAEIERRQLYTACAPMDFRVEDLDSKGVRETGLTRDAIMNAVESRLRAARLFAPLEKQDPIRQQYLYVNVHMHGPAFCVNTELLCNVEKPWLWIAGSCCHCLEDGRGWHAWWQWTVCFRLCIRTP